MPAAIAHYLQVERVINGLKKLHPNFNYNKNAILWGAQGPDFILSHKCLPGQKGYSIKKYGAYLQDKNINNLLNQFFNALDNKNFSNLAKSYFIGFFCHSILDRCAFDFINFGSQSLADLNKNISLKICRNNLKSTLDLIILRYEKQQLPTKINLKKLLPKDEKVENFMANFFSKLLSENYNANIEEKQIFEAINDFRKFFGFMNDRTGIKKELVKKIEKLRKKDGYMSSFIRDITEDDSYDYSNLSHSIWNWPMDSVKNRTESFFDLYEQSIVSSLTFIDNYILNNKFVE